MKFGLGQFTLQIPPWDPRTPGELYRDTLDLAARAEEVGFASIWLAEHHGAADSYNPSLLPMLAAIGARTRRMELGTAVMLAPFHDPIRVAEDAAVVDQISGGRMNLGLGLGWAPHEYKMFGVDPKGRGKRLDEFVNVCNAAWTQDRFSFRGEFFDLDDASVMPKPVRKIPIWLGGNEERALRRAARLGDGHFPPSTAGVGSIAVRAKEIKALRDEAGVSGPFRFGAFLTVGIGENADDGWSKVRDGLLHVRGAYAMWAQGKLDVANAREAAEPFEVQLRAGVVCGSPSQIVEQLRPAVEELGGLGFEDVFISAILAPPGTPRALALEQVERFAEVIEALS
ncbi:MAG: LLM class flavin-dependent oxidoreductase [Actinomycetota bacterium]